MNTIITVSAKLLNIRKTPDLNGEIIYQAKQGEIFEGILINDWYQVYYKGQTGYMMAKFTKTFLHLQKDLLNIDLKPDNKLLLEGTPEEKTVINIYNQYGNFLEKLSTTINIDIATAIAIIAVESGGEGFKDGRLIIRFENHLFYDNFGKSNPSVFYSHFRFNDIKRWTGHKFMSKTKWIDFHGDQDLEWEVFNFASGLDEEKALFSISMGLPQILGSNYYLIGYKSVFEMYQNFSFDIKYHILGLFDFLSDDAIKALQNKYFSNFAQVYNGKGQAKAYGQKIKLYFDVFNNLKY